MSDDLRERVARSIANVREGGWPADTYALLQQHYLTMADAALAEIGGVRVKRLVWEDFEGQGAKASGFYQANYLITKWRGRGEFEVAMSYPGYQTGFDGERFHPTLEAAKAAAQADFESRILAAIEPAPVSVREAALKAQIYRLTAAGDNLTAWVDDRGTPDVRKWDKARDEAFRAIAEGKE